MAYFYYQIKEKDNEYNGFSNWKFPPSWSDVIEADSKKEAKKIIEEEYGCSFPLRVLLKDLEKHDYLLHIKEITKDSYIYRDLLTEHECKECGVKFTMLEKYQLSAGYYSRDYCSHICRDKQRLIIEDTGLGNRHLPVIYKITNKKTGKCYVGQTTQAFTLRWYQHFFQPTNTEFHKQIKGSKVTDWIFEVVEVVEESGDINKRERHWIEEFNAVNDGYNSV